MVRALCILLLLRLTCATQDEQACEAGQKEDSEEVGLIQSRFGPYKKCITPADMDKVIDEFMAGVIALGKLAGNCTEAKDAALKAIKALYAYDVQDVTVLFKPTLTEYPYVYRPTQDGALSYFVGTCVCPGVEKPKEPGCGKEDGYYAPDTGFAFGPDFKGWSKVERGGTEKGGRPGTNFWYNSGGRWCETPQAQGPICFTAAVDGSVTCVDKTFTFVSNPDRSHGAMPALLSAHHSSLQEIGC